MWTDLCVSQYHLCNGYKWYYNILDKKISVFWLVNEECINTWRSAQLGNTVKYEVTEEWKGKKPSSWYFSIFYPYEAPRSFPNLPYKQYQAPTYQIRPRDLRFSSCNRDEIFKIRVRTRINLSGWPYVPRALVWMPFDFRVWAPSWTGWRQ